MNVRIHLLCFALTHHFTLQCPFTLSIASQSIGAVRLGWRAALLYQELDMSHLILTTVTLTVAVRCQIMSMQHTSLPRHTLILLLVAIVRAQWPAIHWATLWWACVY